MVISASPSATGYREIEIVSRSILNQIDSRSRERKSQEQEKEGVLSLQRPLFFGEACVFAKALNMRKASNENDRANLIVSLSVSELVPPWEVSALITGIRKIGADLELSF